MTMVEFDERQMRYSAFTHDSHRASVADEPGHAEEDRMKNGHRFVDSDMHVMEPPDLFDRYLDPKFKHRVLVPIDANGRPRRLPAGIVVDGEGSDQRERARRAALMPHLM